MCHWVMHLGVEIEASSKSFSIKIQVSKSFIFRKSVLNVENCHKLKSIHLDASLANQVTMSRYNRILWFSFKTKLLKLTFLKVAFTLNLLVKWPRLFKCIICNSSEIVAFQGLLQQHFRFFVERTVAACAPTSHFD